MRRFFYIIIAIITVSLAACNDDDTFTVSPSNLLTMDQDTVSFDTVFSRVPTSAKYFWVRNKSGNGVRCSNVRLARGNQSGFRVNVDGVYLGPEAGYKVNDVEVRNGDSIRVFVELTAPKNNVDGPQLREDELVFTLESGKVQKVKLNACTWDADTVHTLHVKGNKEISTAVRPLIVYGGIVVDSLSTLTIAKGTTIYFHDNAGIDVYGKLLCQGDSLENVTLRSYRLDNMFDYLPYDNMPGHWQGIRFHTSSYANVIDYTDIHGCYDGVVCDSANVKLKKLTLSNSIIHNCQGYGLSTTASTVDVSNCQITNTFKDCVNVVGGEVTLIHCTIGQFYPFDLNRGHALYFANVKDKVNYPLIGIGVLNSIITGYADDEIFGVQSDSTDVSYDYYFGYSVLRTPVVDDSLRFEHIIWEPKGAEIHGDKHFRTIDTELLHYDFHLDSLSPAIGAADSTRMILTTREGKKRDLSRPDMGCY